MKHSTYGAMREPQSPKLLFYLRTVLLVTTRFYLPFQGVSILMQRKVLRWHPAYSRVFKWQPIGMLLGLASKDKRLTPRE
jgi:hypothetical protein